MDFEREFDFFKIEDETKRFEIVRTGFSIHPLIILTQFLTSKGVKGGIWLYVRKCAVLAPKLRYGSDGRVERFEVSCLRLDRMCVCVTNDSSYRL